MIKNLKTTSKMMWFFILKKLKESRKFIMVFTKDSGLVKVWVGLVLNANNDYTVDSVPALFNLKVIVTEVVTNEVK